MIPATYSRDILATVICTGKKAVSEALERMEDNFEKVGLGGIRIKMFYLPETNIISLRNCC
jgi:hypothetical protein